MRPTSVLYTFPGSFRWKVKDVVNIYLEVGNYKLSYRTMYLSILFRRKSKVLYKKQIDLRYFRLRLSNCSLSWAVPLSSSREAVIEGNFVYTSPENSSIRRFLIWYWCQGVFGNRLSKESNTVVNSENGHDRSKMGLCVRHHRPV